MKVTRLLMLAGMIAALATLQACATARLKVTQEGSGGRHYERVAVPPFENGVGAALPASAPDNVAGAVVAKLQKSGAFQSVGTTEDRAAGELVVRGTITKYDPGSKALRFILIGLGAGDLKLEVALVDGASGVTVERFSTDGAIVAGGVMGASMGIDDMIASAAGKVSDRVVTYGVASGH